MWLEKYNNPTILGPLIRESLSILVQLKLFFFWLLWRVSDKFQMYSTHERIKIKLLYHLYFALFRPSRTETGYLLKALNLETRL